MKSLTNRTLLTIAAGVTLITTSAFAAVYLVLRHDIERLIGGRLTQFVTERARSEEALLAYARDMQVNVRREVLARLPQYRNAETAARFDEIFMRYPDGAIRSRPEYLRGADAISGWLNRDTVLDDEMRQRMVLLYDAARQFTGQSLLLFHDFYFTGPEQFNIGNDPEGPRQWAVNVPPDFAQNAEEWAYVADVEHNPARTTVMSGVYRSAIWKRLFITIATPIDADGRHIATVSNDIALGDLLTSVVGSGLQGAGIGVMTGAGRLLVHTARMDAVEANDGVYDLADTGDRALAAVYRAVRAGGAFPRLVYDAGTDQHFAVARLVDPDWYLFAALPGALVRSQALHAARWGIGISITALALVLAVLAAGLRRHVAQPLEQLTAVAQDISAGACCVPPELSGRDDEIGRLAQAFGQMAQQVADRDLAVRRDKEELQAAFEQLRSTEERFRALIERTTDYVTIIDAQGITRYASPAVERIMGYKPEERIGHSSLELVHPDDRARLQELQASVLARPGAEIAPFRFRIRHRDGSWRMMESVGANLLDNPAVRGLVLNLRDVTAAMSAEEEIRRSREALHQSEKLAAMGELLAGVAHELNNPLSVVVGRSTMLEDNAGDPAIRNAAQKIRAAAERCARIVKTFLSMARQHEPVRAPVQVNEVVRAALDMLDYSLRTGGIDLAIDLAPDIPQTMADADQLHQVFLNLIVNAQQALNDVTGSRRIDVRSRYDERARRIVVEVVDTGPGIPAAIRSRIFDPYFSTKPTGIGTGVGLSVSLGIVHAHHGELAVDTPANGGAVFSVSLPLLEATSAERPAAPESEEEADGLRLLIVDDEVEIAEMLTDILAPEACRIDVAHTGREALERLAGRVFDVVVTDLRMPDLDGPGLYREIRARYPALADRVVFVTGDALSPSVRAFLNDARRPVIEKPFVPADVRRTVAEVAHVAAV